MTIIEMSEDHQSQMGSSSGDQEWTQFKDKITSCSCWVKLCVDQSDEPAMWLIATNSCDSNLATTLDILNYTRA